MLPNLTVSSLTHLHIAFGYIAPNTFDISTMDGGVPDSVIDRITQLKDTNPAINTYDVDPIWDKDAAVKYVVWGGTSWVSYDDKDTRSSRRSSTPTTTACAVC
ncbi:hypothetical protein VSDG_06041 [Cytospora chrysosperma]|uniref:GH18 domain-containing protein n=1 Tax=Cytospora chrysosperma TaxID=252740 RepID=A0A423VWC0_CYTCH|nr:hypothetical protein VSDG_06041 [Valsa sordida]